MATICHGFDVADMGPLVDPSIERLSQGNVRPKPKKDCAVSSVTRGSAPSWADVIPQSGRGRTLSERRVGDCYQR